MPYTEERNVRVARSGFEDFDQALSWVVKTFDKEYREMIPVQIVIESTPSGQDSVEWTALIAGQMSTEGQ